MATMHSLLPSCLCLLTAMAAAEEAVVEIQIPDGTATHDRLFSGPLAAVLSAESAASLAKSFAVLAPFHDGQAVITIPGAGVAPRFGLRADYGTSSAEALPVWQSTHATMRQLAPVWTPYLVSQEASLLTWSDTASLPWPSFTPTAADIQARLHLGALLSPLGMIAAKTVAALQLNTWTAEARFDTKGSHEYAAMPGRWPSLAAIDREQMRGVQHEALAGLAIGLDGLAIETWVMDVGADFPEMTLGLATIDDALLHLGYPSLSDVLFSLEGTAWMTVMPGAPLPVWTLRIPANPALDSLVDALLPSFAVDSAATRASAQTLQLPGKLPFSAVIRRSADGWLLSSDLTGIDALADGKSAAFDDQEFANLAEGKPAVAIAWSNTRSALRSMAAALPMAGQRVAAPERKILMQMIPVWNALAEKLPASIATVTQTPDGFHLRSEQALIAALTLSYASASLALPTIRATRLRAQQAMTANNLKQLLMVCVTWSMDHDGNFPSDLLTACRDEHIAQGTMTSPYASDTEPLPHYIYIRPQAEIAAWQPVILEDPNRHPESALTYAAMDGSVHVATGEDAQAIWREAQRIRLLESTKNDGSNSADWLSVEAQLNR